MQQVDLLITNGTVVTFDHNDSIFEGGAIAIAGPNIVAVGRSEQILTDFSAPRTIDASHQLVMPGLVNAHTHSPMTLFRGLSDDLPLVPWLNEMSRAAKKVICPDTVRTAALLGYAEKVLGGTTTTLDMYFFPEMLAEAARSIGIRLIAGPVFVSSVGPDQMLPDERSRAARSFFRRWSYDPLIIPCVSPHSTYDVGPAVLQAAHQVAKEFDALYNIHCSETQSEVNAVTERYGCSPVALLEKLGILGDRTVLAHCVHVSDQDIELLAQRQAIVAHCPMSNLKLADGVAPVSRMAAAGVKLTLGTDGPGSSNDLNLWAVIRLAAVLHKGVTLDPTVLPARTVMRMATIEAAEALGLGEKIGSLEAGKRADLILIDLARPHLVPMYDVYSHMAYAIGRDDVASVVIDGQIVVRDRQLERVDIGQIITDVRSIADVITSLD